MDTAANEGVPEVAQDVRVRRKVQNEVEKLTVRRNASIEAERISTMTHGRSTTKKMISTMKQEPTTYQVYPQTHLHRS